MDPSFSIIDQIVVYHFHRPIPDVIHPLHPQHLILGIELFGHSLAGGHSARQRLIVFSRISFKAPQRSPRLRKQSRYPPPARYGWCRTRQVSRSV